MPLTTTTIGAFPKPKSTPIQDWFLGTKTEEEKKASKGLLANWSPGAYEKALQEAGSNVEKLFLESIEQVVTDQVNAGIDVPTDGEVRRESYVLYQCRFLNGISFEEVTHKSVRQGAFEADLPTITGPISSKEVVLYNDWKSAQQFTKNPLKITLPGPMTITDSIANNYYDDMKKLGFDFAMALNKEVKALVDAGCQYIQIDEPVFARKPEAALEYGMENLERTMHGIPKEVQRVCHICCGYPDKIDVINYPKAPLDAYFKIADALEDSSINTISIEDAHRNNDLTLLEKFKTTSIILGVVTIAKSEVEPVDKIKMRLNKSLDHIDKNRLIAAPDCGLGILGRDLAIKKMKNMCIAAHSLKI